MKIHVPRQSKLERQLWNHGWRVLSLGRNGVSTSKEVFSALTVIGLDYKYNFNETVGYEVFEVIDEKKYAEFLLRYS